MVRLKTKYIAEAYAPAILFVVLSWLSFTIKPDAIPGRMMLLLNTCLILVILVTDIKSNSPDVTRINKIDIYIGTCIIHVFGALLEYAILLILMKTFNLEWKPKENQDEFEILRHTVKFSKEDNLASSKDITQKVQNYVYLSKKSTPCFKSISNYIFHSLDWISLFLFPLSFTIFNVYYWNDYEISDK